MIPEGVFTCLTYCCWPLFLRKLFK